MYINFLDSATPSGDDEPPPLSAPETETVEDKPLPVSDDPCVTPIRGSLHSQSSNPVEDIIPKVADVTLTPEEDVVDSKQEEEITLSPSLASEEIPLSPSLASEEIPLSPSLASEEIPLPPSPQKEVPLPPSASDEDEFHEASESVRKSVKLSSTYNDLNLERSKPSDHKNG